MEPEMHDLAALFPNIAAQLRMSLSTLQLAAAQLAPASAREQDPELDAKAALLDQSYYQTLRLVNNLSEAAMLRSEQPLKRKNEDLVQLVGDICLRADSLAKQLELQVRFVCELPQLICAVSSRELEQLLYHLLSNAFKFTPVGGIVTVELRRAGKRVLLSVTDTGCGIAQEKLETLFDRYLHESVMDPRPHGLGLGLPLCRRIAERHGGSIMAESKVGTGSRFTVSLPDEREETHQLGDILLEYGGGFNRTLLGLADAMPAKAFLLRNQK